MGKYGWASFTSVLLTVFGVALYCAAELFGFHWWSAVTHVIVVSCAAFASMFCVAVSWTESDSSPMTMFHYRQLCLLSVHLLSIAGFLYLFEEYAKFSSRWTPSAVRTAPPHELAVEVAWRTLCLIYLMAFASALPGLKAVADYIRGKPGGKSVVDDDF